jgi:hypothetical protein
MATARATLTNAPATAMVSGIPVTHPLLFLHQLHQLVDQAVAPGVSGLCVQTGHRAGVIVARILLRVAAIAVGSGLTVRPTATFVEIRSNLKCEKKKRAHVCSFVRNAISDSMLSTAH